MASHRRKMSRNPVGFLAVLAVFIVLTLIFGITTVSKSNSVKKLNKKIDTLENGEKNLKETISNQDASINDLREQLSFFATPEEGSETQETAISPDSAENVAAEGDLHPNLYAASKSSLGSSQGKVAYLTFDDGPSDLTPRVLDILDQYNAKATFFVIGTTNEEYQKYYSEIINRGHTLALHSYSHNYQKIYASVDAFMDDYQQLYDLIYDKTGYVCSLMRYPGGSKNAYNKNVRADLISQMESRGFIFYDWNVSCGDGSASATKDSVYQKVMNEVSGYKRPVILMHDGAGHQATIDALPQVMQSLSEQGYSFAALTVDNTPVQFPR